ncbi:MAG: MFS transporter [Oscillospiraceae bacterium]|nr:MFS transporter [Oscillospiraceae bacterium]
MRRFRPAFAAFLLMMAMALTTTALSFFVAPVCDELGLGRGSFTVNYSLMIASGAAAIPLLGEVAQKKGVRLISGVSAAWVSLGFLAFSLAGSLWAFYAAGAWIGVFGTACVSLCASIIVQQSYSGSRASGVLGIVMAGSGVGGMVVSLILPGLIQELGWRWGYRILAVCWLILGICAVVLLGNGSKRAVTRSDAPVDGMTRSQALRSPKLYLLLSVSFILSAACGIQQQLPSVLSGYGFAPEQVGVLMSFFTAALALGKIGQGLFYGKVGAVRGGAAVIGMFAASFALLLFRGLTWLGLPALAIGMGTVTTLMPLLTRLVFGNREYPAIWGIVYSAANVGTLIAAPLFGLSYDLSGSYSAAMAASAALLAGSVVLMHLCFRENRHISPNNPLDRNL